ncbi:C-type lectin domain family 3 member A-like [Ruditapes philippinarum]|uniref:C-type lectin domain family 3 member A-like n=1 Tax=Ruditapes philippinarum TaxID=129788 RepID=UPI00295BF219|nr:C-type lectin domain family 3 member A-like [Ruditapes philippinarum]
MSLTGCKTIIFVFNILTIVHICCANQNVKHKARINYKLKNEYVSDEIDSKSLASCLINCSSQQDCISASFKSPTEKCLLSSYDTICDSGSGPSFLTGIVFAEGWTTMTRIKYPDTTMCPDGWTYFENSCYLFGSNDLKFYEAQCFCSQFDANLVNIESVAENDFLRGILLQQEAPKHWIGMTDYDIEDDWRHFPSLKAVTWFDWGPYQPNNGRVSNCAGIWQSFDTRWVDEPCTNLFRPICERK